MVELGSGWNRNDFTWSGIEREKGVFDFGDLPQRVDKSLAMGVNILPILDYEPAWNPNFSPADDETFNDWERYVETTVRQFAGKLPYWQAWNEPNLSFWKPKPSAIDYAELLRRTYFAVKRADPNAKVLGLNCSDIDLDFTEQVFRYGGFRYCDVLAYQPYRIAPEAGHFEEVEALHRLMQKYGVEKPIWFTEMGWGSRHFPLSDADDLLAERPMRKQAAFLVRYMTIILAAGIEKVFWFSQTADDAGLEVPSLGRKRHSFYAYQFLIKAVDDAKELRELIPHGSYGRYAYLYECPNKSVVIAWSVNGPQWMRIPGGSEAREEYDVLGKQTTPLVRNDAVLLSAEPIYLVFDKTPHALEEIGRIKFSPSRTWLQPGESQSISLTWEPQDPSAKSLEMRVETDHPGLIPDLRSIVLSPGIVKTVTITAGKKANPSRGFLRFRSGKSNWDVETNITPEKAFHYRGDSKGYLTPTLLDGAADSFVVASYDSDELLSLAREGTLLWKYNAGAPINSSVAVGDIDGDKTPEIVAAIPKNQTILALSWDGVKLWHRKLPGEPPNEAPAWSWTKPALGDLNGDLVNDIVYADYHGAVTALLGDGEILWNKKISDHRCDIPVYVGPICGDDRNEILVGDDAGSLYCLTLGGEVIWQASTGAKITSSPVGGSLVEKGPPSVFVGSEEKLIRFSSQGLPVWSAELGGTIDLGSGIVLADLDNDGAKEIVVTTRNHEVMAFNQDGNKIWNVETGAQIRSVPAVADIDGDGQKEILVGSADWLLYCIDSKGKIVWTDHVGNRVDGSPLVTGPDGGGCREIILPVRGGNLLGYSVSQRE